MFAAADTKATALMSVGHTWTCRRKATQSKPHNNRTRVRGAWMPHLYKHIHSVLHKFPTNGLRVVEHPQIRRVQDDNMHKGATHLPNKAARGLFLRRVYKPALQHTHRTTTPRHDDIQYQGVQLSVALQRFARVPPTRSQRTGCKRGRPFPPVETRARFPTLANSPRQARAATAIYA